MIEPAVMVVEVIPGDLMEVFFQANDFIMIGVL